MGKGSPRRQPNRRSGKDRRQFTFTLHIPERRRGSDRRKAVGPKGESNISSQNPSGNKDDSESA